MELKTEEPQNLREKRKSESESAKSEITSKLEIPIRNSPVRSQYRTSSVSSGYSSTTR